MIISRPALALGTILSSPPSTSAVCAGLHGCTVGFTRRLVLSPHIHPYSTSSTVLANNALQKSYTCSVPTLSSAHIAYQPVAFLSSNGRDALTCRASP